LITNQTLLYTNIEMQATEKNGLLHKKFGNFI
jgi:hypothetical protein